MKKGIIGHNMSKNLLIHLLSPNVNKVSMLFLRSQMAPLDFNLAIWDAIDNKAIEIKEDEIKVVKNNFIPKPLSVITDLQRKVYSTVQYYDKHEKYVPEVEFFSWAINAYQDEVYQRSAIIGALNWLEDSGLIHSVEAVNPIDEEKENPNKFKFYYITERPDGVSQLFAAANSARQE